MTGAPQPLCLVGHEGPELGRRAGLLKVAQLFFKSPDKGAEGSVYLACSPEVEGKTGGYYVDSSQTMEYNGLQTSLRKRFSNRYSWEVNYTLGKSEATQGGDLAVQESARLALGLRKRPDAKTLANIAEAWRPWRGVAAHLLWAYYHVVKKRDVVPVQPNGRPNEAAGTKTTKRKKKNG